MGSRRDTGWEKGKKQQYCSNTRVYEMHYDQIRNLLCTKAKLKKMTELGNIRGNGSHKFTPQNKKFKKT